MKSSYLAGPSSNRWGVFANGETVSETIKRFTGAVGKKDDRRDHPLFGLVSMLILQEVCVRFVEARTYTIKCPILFSTFRSPTAACSRL